MRVARKDSARPLDQQSGRFRDARFSLSLAMAGSAIMVCSIVGGIIHLYATFLAYQASGYAAAFATLVFPFFAELYWIAVIWSETGTFWLGLAVACIAYFVLCVMLFVAGSVVVSTSDQT
jgi:Ca2+/Na+ antiporter